MSDDSEVGDDVESENNGSFAQNDIVIRRSRCRYGSGCTHIFDPSHRDRFWHPSAPKLNSTIFYTRLFLLVICVTLLSVYSLDEQLKSQFICNECGYATSQLKVLQVRTACFFSQTKFHNPYLVLCITSLLTTGAFAAQNGLVKYLPHWLPN